ncbi:MAG TPA: O-antigen ligase family protein [Bryobacteraceae bacterium]|nr:O-antigen ligase family protein [Bryobacteraceae bacterium]
MSLPPLVRARQIDMLSLVPLIAALVPLIITPGTLAYFDITPKISLLLFATALMLLQLRENLSNLRGLITVAGGRWLVALLAFEWTVFAIATLLSSNRLLSLNGGSWRRFGLISETGLLLFALVATGWMAAGSDRVRMLLRAATWSGILSASYGIVQYFGWDPWLPERAYQAGEGGFTIVRPPSTLGHADYFGAWMVVVLFLAIALDRIEEARWYRLIAIAGAALSAIAIILSGTRAAILAAAIGGLVLLFARGWKFRMREIGAVLACVAILVLFFFSPAGEKLRARLHWSIEDARGGARLLLWRDSLGLSARHPLTGSGPETFTTEFPRFESVQLASAYPDFYHESPHNMFLDALASQGILGLAALAGLCILGVCAGIRLWRSSNPIAAPLAAAFAGLLVSQQFMAFTFATALYFHLLVILLVITAWPSPERVRPSTHPAWAFVPAAIAVILLAYASQLVIADHALTLAERHIASGDIAGATESYQTVLRWQPAGTTSDLSYSRNMQQAAERAPIFATRILARRQALDAGIRAVRDAEDRQNAWYNLAMLLAAQNDAASAERSLRNAIAWAPHWFKPHWALARLLALSGHRDQAVEEARIALECDGAHDTEVSDTWKQLQSQTRHVASGAP